MTAEKKSLALGWCIYGVGVIALGAVCLGFGDFHPGQPVPKDFPARTALAYAAAGSSVHSLFVSLVPIPLRGRSNGTRKMGILDDHEWLDPNVDPVRYCREGQRS